MTELEKLKTAADLIRETSQGRLELCASDVGCAYVRASDDAYIAMNMVMRSNMVQGNVDVTFNAYVRRMGSEMNTKDLNALQQEVQQAYALVQALEVMRFQPTLDDLSAFHSYLKQEQAQRQQMHVDQQFM
ncbi:MAG: hypothetical protein IJZ39_08100 [Oscillospiraceae bacterium]|nr:hypothetical protein [Oscillospiraceae bacterium]